MPMAPPKHRPARGGVRKHNPRRVQHDNERGTAHERGYGARWQKARVWFLKYQPWCTQCMLDKVRTYATVVDHIIPHRGDMAMFWDEENWQALCKQCHDRKTVREDGGFGRAVPARRGGEG